MSPTSYLFSILLRYVRNEKTLCNRHFFTLHLPILPFPNRFHKLPTMGEQSVLFGKRIMNLDIVNWLFLNSDLLLSCTRPIPKKITKSFLEKSYFVLWSLLPVQLVNGNWTRIGMIPKKNLCHRMNNIEFNHIQHNICNLYLFKLNKWWT